MVLKKRGLVFRLWSKINHKISLVSESNYLLVVDAALGL